MPPDSLSATSCSLRSSRRSADLMASGGISGTAVAVATAGAVMIYAGYRGISPVAALRDVASGSPPAVSSTGTTLASPTTDSTGSGSGSALVNAAMKHRDEKYSQPRRWQNGYSDCSSFVGKSLKDIGITPPGASTTLNYIAWRQLTKVSRDDVKAGDLVYTPGHIVIAIDHNTAIGQQNRRSNVQIGPITSLVPSFPMPVFLRYKGW